MGLNPDLRVCFVVSWCLIKLKKNMFTHYDLDPYHYTKAPVCNDNAILKVSWVELDFFNIMLFLLKMGIRGGISYIGFK